MASKTTASRETDAPSVPDLVSELASTAPIPPETMRAGLGLHALSCERGGRRLFSDLSRRIDNGQLLRLTGPNGAGKTSLLRMICGLLAPVAGDILWQGRSLRDLGDELGRTLVYIGHAAEIKDDLSAVENLQFSTVLAGQVVARAAALAALKEAGLAGRVNAPARMLSQGQRRRAVLARLLLAADAPLWVLDEPFNALDTHATLWLCQLIEAHLRRGAVVVLTSHQPVPLTEGLGQVQLELTP